jgi:hypothetical protein
MHTWSAQAENGQERLVDSPHLLACEVSDQCPEPAGVYGTDLLDEDSRGLTLDVCLGSERCWPGTFGGGCHDDGGPWQELVRLNYDSEAIAVLFVTHTFRQTEPVDITSAHVALP